MTIQEALEIFRQRREAIDLRESGKLVGTEQLKLLTSDLGFDFDELIDEAHGMGHEAFDQLVEEAPANEVLPGLWVSGFVAGCLFTREIEKEHRA